MNDNFQNEKNKNEKLKKLYYIISVIVLLGICFSVSYLITDRLTNPKYDKTNIEKSEDKIVYSSKEKLSDDFTIEFIEGSQVIRELSLKEFKSENDIDVDVTEQFLLNYIETTGYKLEALEDDRMVFKKQDEKALLPNKYYLGEKDGYFAIYTTDDNGKAYIENDTDVFKDYKKIDTIPISAEEDIKSLKYCYDSKEEALERLAGYMN